MDGQEFAKKNFDTKKKSKHFLRIRGRRGRMVSASAWRPGDLRFESRRGRRKIFVENLVEFLRGKNHSRLVKMDGWVRARTRSRQPGLSMQE